MKKLLLGVCLLASGCTTGFGVGVGVGFPIGGSGVSRGPAREEPKEIEIHAWPVEYRHGDVVLEGYLAYPKSGTNLPGILIVHEWRGHNSYVRRRAEELAKLGYAAFAVDMYGKGIYAKDNAEASRLAEPFKKDRQLARARAAAGLEVLRNYKKACDPDRIVAMGYCFGGMVALELARSGAPLAGTASFHGDLSTPEPADARNIKGKVIAFHGGDDPYVKPEGVLAFEDEMRAAKVDWQLVAFGGAVHSFTNPDSGNDPSQGVAYNEKADHRSWEMFRQFLGEVFRKR